MTKTATTHTATPNTLRIGKDLHDFIAQLSPICRSITGDGVRRTLEIIGACIPLSISEVPTGTQVLDWTVPREWNVRDAYVADLSGRRVIDFQRCSLHLMGYSVPIRRRMRFAELSSHLHSDPANPDAIPFRYSYYSEDWGFCVSHNDLSSLKDEEYEVVIDSSLENGSLTYAECFLPGREKDEVLISAHTCHPWMCNDNLSGIAIATALASELSKTDRRLSYRFVFLPTTIGSITWLHMNPKTLQNIKHGLVLTCLGDEGDFTFKKTRQGNAPIDNATRLLFQQSQIPGQMIDFTPFGFDERQYSSPGFKLPVACLMRTPHGEFREYHSSADNVDFVKPNKLAESLSFCLQLCDLLEHDVVYVNARQGKLSYAPPQALLPAIGGGLPSDLEEAIQWLCYLCTGQYSVLDIARSSSVPFRTIQQAVQLLVDHEILRAA